MLTRARIQAGFSLVELMVVVTIACLLTLAAMPSIGSWIADARVRTSADALQNAARQAQAEAIRRSRTAVLMLTTAAPSMTATPADNGPRWVVRLLARDSDTSAQTPSLFVAGGTEPAVHNVTVAGPALLCFNALGQQVTLTDTATGLSAACAAPSTGSTPTAYTLSNAAASHDLRVLVSLGGQVRVCNPSKTLSTTALDGC